MIDVSKFVKEHIPLCVCTFGIAILGYLGYHTVLWIIHKCQRIVTIDEIARQNIHNANISSSLSPKSKISDIKIDADRVITMGQGEYIVFHRGSNEEISSLSRETWERVYDILLQFAPIRFDHAESNSWQTRYRSIQNELQNIDSTLEAVFIPRTLYELIFIRQCITEDVDNNSICPNIDPTAHTCKRLEAADEHMEEQAKLKSERNCWHLAHFKNEGKNHDLAVIDVAYRLNEIMITQFNPKNMCFTYAELSRFTKQEISYLETHHNHTQIPRSSFPGPTINFHDEEEKRGVKPMGIRNQADANIIMNALTLDCSEIAQHSFLLYRGTSAFERDSVLSDTGAPYSLSYGSSLFAGCIYDGGATAFYYMRNEKYAYAVPVPFHQLNTSPFYIPPTNIVAQLFGNGELFHSRTKAWQGHDLKNMHGIMGTNGSDRTHLSSNLTQEELNGQFQHYKAQAINIKTSGQEEMT